MNMATAQAIGYRLSTALDTSCQWHRQREVNAVITTLTRSTIQANKDMADTVLDGLTAHVRKCNVCTHTA